MKTITTQSLLLLLATTLRSASAGPTGASACPAGMAAVGATHLTQDDTRTGAIADSPAILKLALDGETVLSTDAPTPFSIGVDHTIELKRMQSAYFFKGFLFRLGTVSNSDANGTSTSLDTTMALIRDPEAKNKEADVQVATTVCVDGEGVGGLTHMDNIDKTSVHGILRVDSLAENIPLDVTVVIRNSNGVSEYYYSRYLLNAVEATAGEGGEGSSSFQRVLSMGALLLLGLSLVAY